MPYGEIAAERIEVEREFTKTRKRQKIWLCYLKYMQELGHFLKWPYFQYIDGSFISKKTVPLDIDLVTFIDYRDYAFCSDELIDLRYRFKPDVDAYLVPMYPPDHPRYELITNAGLNAWQLTFNKAVIVSRQGQNKIFKKGYIKVLT